MTLENILSRDAFLLTMELRLFYLVVVLYIVSFLVYCFALIRPSSSIVASRILLLGAVCHTVLILFRTFEADRPPFQTLYESLSWFSWSVVIAYLYVSRRWRHVFLPGAVVAAIAIGASMYALLSTKESLSPKITPLFPALQSSWFFWHVSLSFLSYAVFVVSFSVEISYLVFNALLKRGRGTAYGLNSSSIDAFHKSAHDLVLFGFPLLTFCLISGGLWAEQAWGRYWSWDPKEVWSLITWTVFTLYLHSMTLPKWRGYRGSIFNFLGFICMMITFLGVNWLAKLLGIPSIHVYAV